MIFEFVNPFEAALVATEDLRPRTAIVERWSSARAWSGSLDENEVWIPIQVVSNEAVVRGVTDAGRLGDASLTPWGAALRRDLAARLRDIPLSDGYDHPAEPLLRDAVTARGQEAASWFSWLVLTSGELWRADALRLLGRVSAEVIEPWGYDLAGAALLDRDVAVRDAAVCALEAWGGAKAAELLASHEDPEPWLTDYARRVAAEL